MSVPRIVVAGAHSGVGKTTVTTGIMAALHRRGLRVGKAESQPGWMDVVAGDESRHLRSRYP